MIYTLLAALYVVLGIAVLAALLRVHGNDPISEARSFWITMLWPAVLVLVLIEVLGHFFLWAGKKL